MAQRESARKWPDGGPPQTVWRCPVSDCRAELHVISYRMEHEYRVPLVQTAQPLRGLRSDRVVVRGEVEGLCPTHGVILGFREIWTIDEMRSMETLSAWPEAVP